MSLTDRPEDPPIRRQGRIVLALLTLVALAGCAPGSSLPPAGAPAGEADAPADSPSPEATPTGEPPPAATPTVAAAPADRDAAAVPDPAIPVNGTPPAPVAARQDPSLPTRYDVREVVVEDGHPVRGLRTGRIFQQVYTSDCQLEAGTSVPNRHPLAGTAGDQLTLRVEYMSCPGEQPPPSTVTCSWDIKPKLSRHDATAAAETVPPATTRQASWDNQSVAEIKVDVPDSIGAYSFELTCAVGEGSEPQRTYFERTLYATYSTPRETVSPVAVQWYARATDWARGFSSSATEHEVLKGLLSGIYDHGQRHWQYGVIPIDYNLNDPFLPDCNDIAGRWCTCPWQALVSADSSCTFADCYKFSEVFEAMAATLGIGVFEPVVIAGELQSGFVTHPDSASLDPAFRRNIICDPDYPGDCPAYIFSSHSIRGRDGVYYDTTFNRIYTSLNDPVFHSIKSRDRGTVAFIGTTDTLLPAGWGYGQWAYYRHQTNPDFVSSPILLQPPAPRSDPSVIRFLSAHFFPIPDTRDFNGEISRYCEPLHDDPPEDPGLTNYRFRAIAVDVRYRLFTNRPLVMGGTLESTAGELISNRPSSTRPGFSGGEISGEGQHCERLLFSGEDVFKAGVDGQYRVKVTASWPGFVLPGAGIPSFGAPVELSSSLVAEQEWDSERSFIARLFGENKADLMGAGAEGFGAGSQPGDVPEAVAEVVARHSDTYLVAARLARDGKTLAYANQRLFMVGDANPRIVRVEFDPETVRRHAADGPMVLTVELLDQHAHSFGYRSCPVGSPTEPACVVPTLPDDAEQTR